MAARQNGHCGAWSGMLHTALAHGMHILQSSTNRAVSTLSTADIKTHDHLCAWYAPNLVSG